MGCILYSGKSPALSLLFHVLFYSNPASGTPFQYCTNYLGEEIEDGVQYIPSADDLCYRCTCDGGYPVACSSVFCSPPDCKLYEVIEDECCKFICLEAADTPDIINNNDTREPVLPKDGLEYLDSANLPLRLVASTVTSFLILALLLFMVHRLRQRRTLIMLRRLNAERQEEDTVAYLPQMDNIDIGIEFPPYEDPPPPYTPPKPPYLPEGEAPPPYDDTNGNVINTSNSMTTSDWIDGDTRHCNGQINDIAANQDVPSMHSVNRLNKDGEQTNSECNENSHQDIVKPQGVQLRRPDTFCMCNKNSVQDVGEGGLCPVCGKTTIVHDASCDQLGSANQRYCHSSMSTNNIGIIGHSSSDTLRPCHQPNSEHEPGCLIENQPCVLPASLGDCKYLVSNICVDHQCRERLALSQNANDVGCSICHSTEIDSQRGQAACQTVHSELEPGMASGVNSLPLKVLDNSKFFQHRNLEDPICQSARPDLTAFSQYSRQSYKPHISEAVFSSTGLDSTEHTVRDNRNDSPSTPTTPLQMSKSSVQQSSPKSCSVSRSGSFSSEASLLSVCSETGERKRPPVIVHQDALQPDVKYPETPFNRSHIGVHDSSTAAPVTMAAELSSHSNRKSQTNYDSVENTTPDCCETVAEQCSSVVDEPDNLGFKRSVGEDSNRSVQEKTTFPGSASENAMSLQVVNTTAYSPVNYRHNTGSLPTVARKGWPVSVPNSVTHLKHRCKLISRSTSGQNSLKEHDIPQFKQYGFIDNPELLFACKDKSLYPKCGDTVLSALMFEKLHHSQQSNRHTNRKRNHNSPGYSYKSEERSSHNSRKLSLSPEHVSNKKQDCAVNIDSHQCSEPFKVNFIHRCAAHEKTVEPNKSHVSRHRRKHKSYTKKLKSNSRNDKTTLELNPLEPGGLPDILNNNLLDNYCSLNSPKISTGHDTVSDHQVDNLSSQIYRNSDLSYEER